MNGAALINRCRALNSAFFANIRHAITRLQLTQSSTCLSRNVVSRIEIRNPASNESLSGTSSRAELLVFKGTFHAI